MNPRPIARVVLSPDFDKAYSRLPERIQALAKRRTSWFQANAYDARLKTHALSGRLEGLHALWVNREYRILFRFSAKDAALFITIGTHSVYQ